MLTNARVLQNQGLIKASILIENGVIKAIGNIARNNNKQIIDVNNQIIVPGFIDIHTHGANGVDVNHATVEELHELSNFYASRGVTSYLPTLLTDDHETMCHILETIKTAKDKQTRGATILGVHMEGPFLDVNFKGAMPGHLIQKSSVEVFKIYEKAAGGLLQYITVSVGGQETLDLIQYAKSKGIVVALGHTGGTYRSCLDCIAAGANSAAHLFNAMAPINHHHPSIIEAALESDIYTELICDGLHLHPGIVRLVIKAKGLDRVIGITDSIMAAGLEDGNYQLGINEVVVKDGDASLVSDGSRAGSTLTMDLALRNIMEFTHLPLELCSQLITKNPARLLSIQDQKGEIATGKDADLVILNDDYTVDKTFVKGLIQ